MIVSVLPAEILNSHFEFSSPYFLISYEHFQIHRNISQKYSYRKVSEYQLRPLTQYTDNIRNYCKLLPIMLCVIPYKFYLREFRSLGNIIYTLL